MEDFLAAKRSTNTSLATDAVPSSGRVFSSVISTLFETCAGQRRRHGINEAVHQH